MESARIIAGLARLGRDVGRAEELAQGALPSGGPERTVLLRRAGECTARG